MELITRESLPSGVKKLTDQNSQQPQDVRLSLYLPNYRSQRNRIWKQSRKLLGEAKRLLSSGLSPSEASRRLNLIEEKIFLEQSDSEAQGFAYFVDKDHLESQPLQLRPEPLVVVSASFHVIPLLRSVASEPTYRLIIIRKDEGLIFKKEHDEFICELRSEFLKPEESQSRSVFKKCSDKELSMTWRNIEDFSNAFKKLQSLDPKPIALFGSEKLRHIVIEDIRGGMTRPIFIQSSADLSLKNLVEEADSAFRNRLSDEMPFDINAQIAKAHSEHCLESDIEAIYREAKNGNVKELLITQTKQKWGLIEPTTGVIDWHNHQVDHTDDCIIDDTVELVIQQAGAVLFIHNEDLDEEISQLEALRDMNHSGICAITHNPVQK